MFPGFDALPEVLRPVARPQPPNAHPVAQPPAQALVDCGVYVCGQRLPGKYTYAAALREVREIELTGQERRSSGSGCTSPMKTRCRT